MATSQKALLMSGIKALKPGGTLVYSTCTLSPEENEEVIYQALQQMPVELVKIELPELTTRPGLTAFRSKQYSRELENCVRIYPFENQTEGFFLAKLRKTDAMEMKPRRAKQPILKHFISDKTSPVKKYLDYFSQHFEIPRNLFSNFFYLIKNDITAVTSEIAKFDFYTKPFKTGLTIARPMTHIAKLTTEGVHFLGDHISANKLNLQNLSQLEAFVNRNTMDIFSPGNLQTALFYRDIAIGYGLTDDGKLKSQFPKAEWPFTMSSK
jgi:hypothetical protein